MSHANLSDDDTLSQLALTGAAAVAASILCTSDIHKSQKANQWQIWIAKACSGYHAVAVSCYILAAHAVRTITSRQPAAVLPKLLCVCCVDTACC